MECNNVTTACYICSSISQADPLTCNWRCISDAQVCMYSSGSICKINILTTSASLCQFYFNDSELIGNQSPSSSPFQLSISLAVSDTVFFSLLNQSYEHSGEIELAHLKSNCPKSFEQYARYELGDCRSIDLRERKNKNPISHKPSLTWKSFTGVTSLRSFDLCFV